MVVWEPVMLGRLPLIRLILHSFPEVPQPEMLKVIVSLDTPPLAPASASAWLMAQRTVYPGWPEPLHELESPVDVTTSVAPPALSVVRSAADLGRERTKADP